MKLTTEEKRKQGKKNKRKGGEFERLVREDLQMNGWYVLKNSNNVDLVNGKMIAAKPKFNPFTKALMSNNSGFPDFFCWRSLNPNYNIIGVESKSNGYLDKEEREKCDWLLKNFVVSKIFIAFKDKNGEVEYKEYGRKE